MFKIIRTAGMRVRVDQGQTETNKRRRKQGGRRNMNSAHVTEVERRVPDLFRLVDQDIHISDRQQRNNQKTNKTPPQQKRSAKLNQTSQLCITRVS